MSIDNDESIEEQSKLFGEALKCFDKALEIDPKYTDVLNNKGYAWDSKGDLFYDKNDYDQALVCYDKALEIFPNYTVSWNSKGLAFFNKKDYDQALKCFDKALEIDPNYTYAWNNKGLALSNEMSSLPRRYDIMF